MAEEEEFREMVIKKLENRGIFQKMRAELRAHIYHSIEQDISNETTQIDASNSTEYQRSLMKFDDTLSTSIDSSHSARTDDQTMALYLVQNLLDCLNLSYTSSVFRKEVGCIDSNFKPRSHFDIIEALQSNDYGLSILDEGKSSESDGFNDILSNKSGNEKRTPILIEILRKFNNNATNNKQECLVSSKVESKNVNDETFITPEISANQTSESL